jgi:anaerobic ribonucleoside-triphosphate reductase
MSYSAVRPSVQALLQNLKGWEGMVGQGSHKVLNSIRRCRTSALGYHAYRCLDSECGAMQYQYHSCRNRHCPHCGSAKKEEWTQGPHA